ncbi:HAD-IIB family hydrolase [Paenibacillus ginsengarvi]|uniref:HAD family phosphatase n=1 Tax=Paenibacillus ginsengarvi TaxID=400777 RepID=A0A3B0CH58_9BACL|nr:HAD family hydrolase [Paenibacillus ginsengarvi]RKN84470.1 HAD family phosphatase [Paenibacillus ginsengarvi]
MRAVFDLDGTICFAGKPLSKQVVRVLEAAEANGHELIFASARPIRDLLPVLPAVFQHHALVGGNGAFVAAGGRIISTIHFDPGVAEAIMALLHKYGVPYMADGEWDYAYTGHPDHPLRRKVDPKGRATCVPIGKLAAELVKVAVLDDSDRLAGELEKLPVVIHKHGSEGIIDISPEGVDKWAGLQKLGVTPNSYIAFGNDANDIAMFRHARHSVCVGNYNELAQMAAEQVHGDEASVIQKIAELVG